jgi:D-amino-acid dehydrogenase
VAAHLAGATYAPEDESGDARMFTQGLARLCAERGVRFRYGTDVEHLVTGGGKVTGVHVTCSRAGLLPGERAYAETLTADAWVVALGSYSPLLLRPIGVPALIYPAKGYSATLPIRDPRAGAQHERHRRLGEDRVHAPGITVAHRGHGRAQWLRHRAQSRALCGADAPRHRAVPGFLRVGQGRVLDGPAAIDAVERPADRTHAISESVPEHRPRNTRLDDGIGSGKALAQLIDGKEPEVDFAFL